MAFFIATPGQRFGEAEQDTAYAVSQPRRAPLYEVKYKVLHFAFEMCYDEHNERGAMNMVKVNGKTSGISLHYTKHKGNNAGVNGLQRHNERKPGQKHSNKKIDDQRTEDNVFLKSAPKTYYKAIEDKISENRKNGMKGVRKDAVRMVEATVQLSGKVLDQPEEKQEEVLRDMYEWLKDEHGEDNIISAVIHKDETSMHLHFDFVPITEEGKLSAKEILSKGKLKYKQDSSLKHVQDKHPAMHFKRGGGETKGLSQKDFEAFKTLQEEKETMLDEYTEALDEQDDELNEREDLLDKREETLNEKEGTLNKNANKVRKMHADVHEREKKVTARESTLDKREGAYTAKLTYVTDKENKLNEREGSLSEKVERLNEQQDAVKRQKTALDVREREVDVKDQGADQKLLEAKNTLNTATEKEEHATDKLSEAKELNDDVIFKLAETEKRLAEIQKENKESRDILKELKRFGTRLMHTVEAIRNGNIGLRTAKRTMNELETPFDNAENVVHNNLVLDDLEDKQQNGLQH